MISIIVVFSFALRLVLNFVVSIYFDGCHFFFDQINTLVKSVLINCT